MKFTTNSIRSLLAVLLSLVLCGGTFVAAFAEDEAPSEAPATTSTTAVTEAEEPEEEEPTLPSEESSATTTTTEPEEASTSPTEEESTATTTEPVTEPDPEPEPDFAPDYTGIAKTTYDGELAWWRVVKGEVRPKATGVFQNENGWFYVKNGKVDWNHTGVEKNENGWWRIKNGRVDFGYTGIAKNANGWWRIVKGHVDFSAEGVYQNEYGWWKVKGGKVDFGYTGIAKNEYGWWRIVKGKVDFNATGVYKNEYGSWYVKKGKADFTKTGTVVSGKTSYTVQKGKVTGVTMKVPLVNQKPNYPTGCEAASCTMLLKYYGYDITLAKMINTIPRENLRTVDGKRYGPRITEKFVGDPRSSYTNANPGYGAFAPVVTKSLNNVIQNQHGKHKAVNKTGATFSELLNFLDEGKPVIVWSTYNMQTPTTVNAWYIATPTGPEYFSYPRGTHVCVLIGYDAKNVYLADPYGATNKTFSRSAFNDKYKLLGRQAVLLQ
ncbi:MAG: C39 family peptidase [Bacteroidales bacterium]|nr:C39 family peptidase [Clostridia bacterium]MBR1699232.1 C39 family peptidase [Bacteroidales bacterium]